MLCDVFDFLAVSSGFAARFLPLLLMMAFRTVFWKIPPFAYGNDSC